MLTLLVLAAGAMLPLAGGAAAAAFFPNMNGEYLTTPTPHAPTGVRFNTSFSAYPGGVEYFEVELGPITSLYSEVWWQAFPAVALPDGLAARFDGKGMSIVGYETDAVRKTPHGDVSVPINMAYNHHHDVYLTGKHSRMERVPYDPLDLAVPLMARGDPHVRDARVETSLSPNDLPTSLHLADGNGGEYRKSYHGLPPPVAYVIDSPQSVYVNPMFIDTWHRDKMNISGGSAFVAGPLPQRNEAPAGAEYSGLLECPLTTRIRKLYPGGNDGWNSTFVPTLFDCGRSNATRSCAHSIDSADACFAAAVAAVGAAATVHTEEGASDAVAAGCTVTYGGGASAKAFFNTRSESTACCGAGVAALRGEASSLVDVALVLGRDNVTITLTGPSSVWFGVGFFAQAMEEKPYALIVDGVNGSVTERQLASHMGSAASPGGAVLKPRSITVLQSSVVAGRRTIVLTRPAMGATVQHATFTLQDTEIPFINAVGASPVYAYHLNKTASTLSLWPTTEQAVCLCEQPAAPFGSCAGTIEYAPTREKFGFINGCSPEPRESILANRNPTCDIRAYAGGLQVCKHKWSLLDAEQEQPWPDQPLVYYQVGVLYCCRCLVCVMSSCVYCTRRCTQTQRTNAYFILFFSPPSSPRVSSPEISFLFPGVRRHAACHRPPSHGVGHWRFHRRVRRTSVRAGHAGGAVLA